jgi:hypothetical protein
VRDFARAHEDAGFDRVIIGYAHWRGGRGVRVNCRDESMHPESVLVRLNQAALPRAQWQR